MKPLSTPQKQSDDARHHRANHGNYFSHIKINFAKNKKLAWIIGTLSLVGVPIFVLAAQQSPTDHSPSNETTNQAVPDHSTQGVLNPNLPALESGINSGSSSNSISGEAETKSRVEVNINGRSVPVPESGTLHYKQNDRDSETTLDLNIDSSSTSIDIQSTTRSHSSSQNSGVQEE
jgi:hypothetical protein